MMPGANLILLDVLQAFGVTREGTAEVQVPPQEKTQPPKVSSTGNVVRQTEPLARGVQGERVPSKEMRVGRGSPAWTGELLFPCLSAKHCIQRSFYSNLAEIRF